MTQNCHISVPVLLCLFFFGIGYNTLIERLIGRGHHRGYMGFIVAIGTAVTLAGIAVICGIEAAAWATACFIASGLPMIYGSIARHTKQRTHTLSHTWEKAQQALDDYDQETQ